MDDRTSLDNWQKLTTYAKNDLPHLATLFAEDPTRFDKYSLQAPHLLLDYSKNLINDAIFDALTDLASECRVEQWRDKMFAGDHINNTEDRAVLHTALRGSAPINATSDNINNQVQQSLNKVERFTEQVRSGQWRGYSNQEITDVVSIGIGGSNLGPLMITEALSSYADQRLKMHYVSNVDGVQIADVLASVNPETTLFIIASKTFTTSETMTNATTAVNWLIDAVGDKEAIAKHFVAVSTNTEKVTAFGIDPENMFTMWDWVGGRFSLWSAIGLPISLYLGFDSFKQLLAGAKAMDEHFLQAPLTANAPVIMALIGVWNCSFLNLTSQAILPYDQCLHRLPAYLQQAEMESNGKSVDRDGNKLTYNTVAGLWGEVGINGQHAFYQYLHQGNTIVPADFIGSVNPVVEVNGHHNTLMSNFFAQTEALMKGVSLSQVEEQLANQGLSAERIEQLASHKVHDGNRPTNSILLNQITPESLGALIALYEHKIFVQGVILNINSFDQWGVELGKVLAKGIERELDQNQLADQHDSSTLGLMTHYLANR